MHRRVFDEPGHAHFLTFSCAARRQLLNQDRCKRIVIHHLEAVRAEYDGLCFGFVMMPEHVHALVRFRETGQLSLFAQTERTAFGLRSSTTSTCSHTRKRGRSCSTCTTIP